MRSRCDLAMSHRFRTLKNSVVGVLRVGVAPDARGMGDTVKPPLSTTSLKFEAQGGTPLQQQHCLCPDFLKSGAIKMIILDLFIELLKTMLSSRCAYLWVLLCCRFGSAGSLRSAPEPLLSTNSVKYERPRTNVDGLRQCLRAYVGPLRTNLS